MARLFRVILPVSDIKAATEFYSQLLGVPGKRVSPGRHYFDCGGTILACFDPRADGDSFDARPNPDHVYFAVAEVEQVFERAKAIGCREIDDRICTRPWGERGFYAQDPFGNPVCFVDEGTIFTGESAMIRPAAESDAPAILSLIRELAEYEHLTHACVATEELLSRHLFGGDRAAEALVAEENGAVVGYAIFFKTFSTFLALPGIYLEDIYVQPAHRGRGIGKAMLRQIARIAIERGYGRVEWSVLDWNTPSIEFYKRLGAAPLEDWTMFRLTGEALKQFGS